MPEQKADAQQVIAPDAATEPRRGGTDAGGTPVRVSAGRPDTDGDYLTALAATVIAVPIVATVTTVGTYHVAFAYSRLSASQGGAAGSAPADANAFQRFVVGAPAGVALLVGLAAAVVVWAILAGVSRRNLGVAGANTTIYRELYYRYVQLKARLWCLKRPEMAPETVGESVAPPLSHTALAEAEAYRDAIARELGFAPAPTSDPPVPRRPIHNGLRWVSGTGYVNLWHQMHRAEEALIELAPAEAVIAGAQEDARQIRAARLDDAEGLLRSLRQAIRALDEAGAPYVGDTTILPSSAALVTPLASAAAPVLPTVVEDAVAPNSAARTSVPDRPRYGAHSDRLARAILRSIRRTVNDYRDVRRSGLLRARHQLSRTTVFTAFVVYALLALALVADTDSKTIIGATVFYLVGAIVGLFNRLHADSKVEVAGEDYGLATTRLTFTLLSSGLAALGGVLIIPMLALTLNAAVVAPQPDGSAASPPAALLTPGAPAPPAPSSTSGAGDVEVALRTAGAVPQLKDIFNVARNPFGLVVAAVFGLTPNLLLARLQQQTEQYSADLSAASQKPI